MSYLGELGYLKILNSWACPSACWIVGPASLTDPWVSQPVYVSATSGLSHKVSVWRTMKRIFFACIKFLWISRVVQNCEIKYPRKFRPGKYWENAKLKCSEVSTFQNREIKMQLFYSIRLTILLAHTWLLPAAALRCCIWWPLADEVSTPVMYVVWVRLGKICYCWTEMTESDGADMTSGHSVCWRWHLETPIFQL